MDVELTTHHHESEEISGAVNKVSDALPGFGIVAAVLGIVNTMAALGGPVQEIGQKVAAALVGTFLGILLAYGFVGPYCERIGENGQGRRPVFHHDQDLHHRDGAGFIRRKLRLSSAVRRRRVICVRPLRNWKRRCAVRSRQRHGRRLTTIILKRINAAHPHHGGSWKVAFADFATAMMAFFLMMWLMGATTADQRGGISQFFKNPSVVQGASPLPSPSAAQGPGGASHLAD